MRILLCLAMFGLSLIAALVATTMTGAPRRSTVGRGAHPLARTRPVRHRRGPARRGRSLGLPDPYAKGLTVFSVIFGVVTWGFAMRWLALATAVTVKTACTGELRFN
ncbi:hypothetical protein ACQPXH_27810 [Nocardia sp. CA-135953]|uniref:hypothetical protein n=1 Tax=Nocardia sp. CA-135953 TaxID=3239978 RepID=UPI003D999B1D